MNFLLIGQQRIEITSRCARCRRFSGRPPGTDGLLSAPRVESPFLGRPGPWRGIADAEGIVTEGSVEEGVTRAVISGMFLVYKKMCPNFIWGEMGPIAQNSDSTFTRDPKGAGRSRHNVEEA
jgi:hypothetical protein